MNKFYSTLLTGFLIITGSLTNSARACYANFTHTNACAGDTVWFYGLDFSAVHTWDFGDTTVNNPNLAFDDTAYHIFSTPGTYYVTHFVNIGAEWAFETQAVIVGTDCFHAGFHARCNGSFSVVFENLSSGNNLTYSWNFGEPSSGTADTSSLLSPYHTYAAAGNYTVTLIIDNGTGTDTSIQIITVDSACMTSFISYQWNPCAGDTTFFYYNFIGVSSVFWDFGDPAAGINNYSTLLTPTHIFASPGVYVGMVVFTNGINTDTLPVVTRVVDCSVWPGDANRDGYVTGEDLLAVALYYGDTGAVRTNATTAFSAQPATNWVNSTNWSYMYLQDLVDKKHADCNGDGVINNDDVSVIIQNFGLSHQVRNNLSSMMITNPSDPHLSLMLPTSVSGSAAITAQLNYGDSLVHTPIYGVCVYVDYDPVQVDANSISVDFGTSFLDSVSVANLVSFYHNDLVNHRIVIVEARTDHTGMNSYGNLANITFNAAAGYTGALEIHIGSDSKVMSNAVIPGSTYGNVQNFIKVNTDDASTQVSLGVIETDPERLVSVYPSPASGYFRLDVRKSAGNYAVNVMDVTGRVLTEKYPVTNHQLIDIHSLAAGLYVVQVRGDDWTIITKVMIER